MELARTLSRYSPFLSSIKNFLKYCSLKFSEGGHEKMVVGNILIIVCLHEEALETS